MSSILSLINAIFAASTLTSLPIFPIAIPTFAFLSDGASFTPSPIIATLWPRICSFLIYLILSSGRQFDLTFLIFRCFAMKLAVFSLSPVSNVVLIRNLFKFLMVSGDRLRIVSAKSIFPRYSLFLATNISVLPFSEQFLKSILIFFNSNSSLFPAIMRLLFMLPVTPFPICILKSLTSARLLAL